MKGQNTCRLAGRCSSSFCSSPVLLSPSWRRHLLSLEVPDIEGQSSSLPANCCSTSSHGSKPPFCAPRPLSSSSPSQHASRFSSPSRGLLTALLASTTGHRSFSSVPNGEERRKKTPSAATVIDHISLSRHYRTFVPSKGLLHISSAASLTRGFRDNQGGLKVQEKKQEDHLPAPRGLRLFFRGLSSVTERKTNPDCVPAGEETWEREEEKAATPGLSPRLKRLMYRAKQVSRRRIERRRTLLALYVKALGTCIWPASTSPAISPRCPFLRCLSVESVVPVNCSLVTLRHAGRERTRS